MHSFEKICVVIDPAKDNKIVLSHVKDIASNRKVQVSVLCVMPTHIQLFSKEELHQSIEKQLPINFEMKIVSGVPVIFICNYCSENNISLLLIGSEKQTSALNRFFHGSLVLSLMRKAPCPVWVVKKPVSSTYERILISVDPESEHSSLNDKLIDLGTSYANLESAECFLVAAWELEGEETMRSPFINLPEDEIQKQKEERKSQVTKDFETLYRKHNEKLKSCQKIILNGSPGNVVAEFVKDNMIDLIVMGTVARSGLKGFLIGNTAEAIINQVDCSIMAIKPDNFICPVLD